MLLPSMLLFIAYWSGYVVSRPAWLIWAATCFLSVCSRQKSGRGQETQSSSCKMCPISHHDQLLNDFSLRSPARSQGRRLITYVVRDCRGVAASYARSTRGLIIESWPIPVTLWNSQLRVIHSSNIRKSTSLTVQRGDSQNQCVGK